MYKSSIDFIKQQFPNLDFIPLHAPVFNGNEKKYLMECIDSTFVSSVGKFVDEFELNLAKYTGLNMLLLLLTEQLPYIWQCWLPE